MSPDEKELIEAKAGLAGLTVSEYVRRAALSDEDPVDAAIVEALAEEGGAMAERLDRKLDDALRDLAETRLRTENRDAIRRRAISEIEEHGFTWPFPVREVEPA